MHAFISICKRVVSFLSLVMRFFSSFNEDENDSSSDEDAGNPMVAGFQEELDSDDQINTGKLSYLVLLNVHSSIHVIA